MLIEAIVSLRATHHKASSEDHDVCLIDATIPTNNSSTGKVNGLSAIACIQFLENVLYMLMNGGFGDREFAGNLTIFAALAHQIQDLLFPLGEGAHHW